MDGVPSVDPSDVACENDLEAISAEIDAKGKLAKLGVSAIAGGTRATPTAGHSGSTSRSMGGDAALLPQLEAPTFNASFY